MIEFSQLEIVHKVEDKQLLMMKQRYIMGADPFEQKGVLSGINVFTIYDKQMMRIVSKTVTTQSFDKWLNWVLMVNKKTEVPIRKGECFISHKFINKNGSATNPAELRR